MSSTTLSVIASYSSSRGRFRCELKRLGNILTTKGPRINQSTVINGKGRRNGALMIDAQRSSSDTCLPFQTFSKVLFGNSL